MLTRRAILAAVPALAACAAPCGPTNPPQPGLVHIGRLDMGQDLHGRDPDPFIATLVERIGIRRDEPTVLRANVAPLPRRT